MYPRETITRNKKTFKKTIFLSRKKVSYFGFICQAKTTIKTVAEMLQPNPTVWSMDEGTIKTQNPKCRLY
jgi:hypothetical protein